MPPGPTGARATPMPGRRTQLKSDGLADSERAAKTSSSAVLGEMLHQKAAYLARQIDGLPLLDQHRRPRRQGAEADARLTRVVPDGEAAVLEKGITVDRIDDGDRRPLGVDHDQILIADHQHEGATADFDDHRLSVSRLRDRRARIEREDVWLQVLAAAALR